MMNYAWYNKRWRSRYQWNFAPFPLEDFDSGFKPTPAFTIHNHAVGCPGPLDYKNLTLHEQEYEFFPSNIQLRWTNGKWNKKVDWLRQ